MLTLCDRFKCLPSQVAAEPVTLLRYLAAEEAAVPDEFDVDGWGAGVG